jgi:hypothetical protein
MKNLYGLSKTDQYKLLLGFLLILKHFLDYLEHNQQIFSLNLGYEHFIDFVQKIEQALFELNSLPKNFLK